MDRWWQGLFSTAIPSQAVAQVDSSKNWLDTLASLFLSVARNKASYGNRAALTTIHGNGKATE